MSRNQFLDDCSRPPFASLHVPAADSIDSRDYEYVALVKKGLIKMSSSAIDKTENNADLISSKDDKNKKILKSGLFANRRGENVKFLPQDGPDDSPHRQHHRNFDINLYATKKSAAQGLLDLALLMANASQLKHIILTEGQHRFYGAMIALLSASIALQIIVAIGLLILARVRIYDYGSQMSSDNKDEQGNDQTDAEQKRKYEAEEERVQSKLRRADFLNNVIVAGIFILTVINVFISAFGLNESPRKEQVTTQN